MGSKYHTNGQGGARVKQERVKMSEVGKWPWKTRDSGSLAQFPKISGFSAGRGNLGLDSAKNSWTLRARPHTETWPTRQFRVWLDTSNLPIPPPVDRRLPPPPLEGLRDLRKSRDAPATKETVRYRTLKRQNETRGEKGKRSVSWNQQECHSNSVPRGVGTPSRMGRHSLFSYANTHPLMADSNRVSPWVTANVTEKMMLLRTVVRNPWMLQQARLHESKHASTSKHANHVKLLNLKKSAPRYYSDVSTPSPPPCLNKSIAVLKLS